MTRKEKQKMIRHVVLDRKDLLNRVADAAKEIKSIVGITMSSNGSNISLSDSRVIDDGANIIASLNHDHLNLDNFDEIDNQILREFLSRLSEATSKTDELAGDGTTATTVLTSALMDAMLLELEIGDYDINQMNKWLDEFEVTVLKHLDETKKELKTEEDYIKLATVSSKDEGLGRLIGSAIYKTKDNPSLSIHSSKKKFDYVSIESHYVIGASLAGYGLIEHMEDAEVIVFDDSLKGHSTALDKISDYAFNSGTRKKVLIMCSEIDEVAIEYIRTVNNENRALGEIAVSVVPDPGSRVFSVRDLMEDVADYVNTKVYNSAFFTSGTMSVKDIKLGKIKEFQMSGGMTVINTEKRTKSCEAKILKLKGKIDKLEKDLEQEQLFVLRQRINMLSGNIIKLYIYATDASTRTTKMERVRDAIKATQFTIGFGYVLGAGAFYRHLANDEQDSDNPLFRTLHSIHSTIFSPMALRNEDMYYDKDGNIVKGDLYEAGIIDSAKVVENVIINSVSIAREYLSIGKKIIAYER